LSKLPGKLGRRILLGVLFGVLVYAGMAFWVDVRGIRDALARLPLWVLPAACALSFANYGIRFWKWQRYLRLLKIDLPRGTSWLIYLAGFSMSVTPGKLGEVFKAWLIRRINGTPIHVSAPIIIAERFTDLLAYLILVALGGIASYPQYQWVFWLTLGLCALGLVLAGSVGFSRFTARLFKRLPYLWRLAPRIEGSFASTRILLSPREILLPTLTSVVGWGCECAGFWLIASQLVDKPLPFLAAVFAYAFSAIAGAVLIIFPGGLGITEGSMGTILRRQYSDLGGLARDVARQKAAGAVILSRLCTLWFAVLVGLIATMRFTQKYGGVEENADAK
jgi:glycosyltransferase 2 family protein